MTLSVHDAKEAKKQVHKNRGVSQPQGLSGTSVLRDCLDNTRNKPAREGLDSLFISVSGLHAVIGQTISNSIHTPMMGLGIIDTGSYTPHSMRATSASTGLHFHIIYGTRPSYVIVPNTFSNQNKVQRKLEATLKNAKKVLIRAITIAFLLVCS